MSGVKCCLKSPIKMEEKANVVTKRSQLLSKLLLCSKKKGV